MHLEERHKAPASLRDFLKQYAMIVLSILTALALERGATGLQVQRAHMFLGKTRRSWPELEWPTHTASLTVRDVLNASPGDVRDAVLLDWCAAVWASWNHAQPWTRQICDELLAESFSRRVRGR